MLRLRLVTAVVGLPLVVAVALIGGPLLTAVVALLLAIAAAEIYRAAGMLRTPGAAIGIGLAAAAAPAAAAGSGWPQGIVAAMVVVPLLWPVLAGRTATALHDWAIIAGGALYIGWLGSHLVLVHDLPDGRDWLLLAVMSVFATDTAAYLSGRTLGRHKMAPRISPKKTWEGAIGGFAGGFAAVLGLYAAFDLAAAAAAIIGLALMLPIAAQLGDLAESALKRSMNVKDMGGLLPGHGGVADRLDSVLFAAPMLYYWVRWVVM